MNDNIWVTCKQIESDENKKETDPSRYKQRIDAIENRFKEFGLLYPFAYIIDKNTQDCLEWNMYKKMMRLLYTNRKSGFCILLCDASATMRFNLSPWLNHFLADYITFLKGNRRVPVYRLKKKANMRRVSAKKTDHD